MNPARDPITALELKRLCERRNYELNFYKYHLPNFVGATVSEDSGTYYVRKNNRDVCAVSARDIEHLRGVA
jgi:hypothetical protein